MRLNVFFRRSLNKRGFEQYIRHILQVKDRKFTTSDLKVSFKEVKKAHYEAINKEYIVSQGYTTVIYNDNVRGRVRLWSLKPQLKQIAEEIFKEADQLSPELPEDQKPIPHEMLEPERELGTI